MMKKTAILAALLSLSACALSPQYQRPAVAVPAQWQNAPTQPGEDLSQWWGRFGSPELTTLEAQALKQNLDLRAGIHRVEQARASAQVADASLWPTADLSGGLTGSFSKQGSGKMSYTPSARAGVDVSYEVDLFGRNRAALTSAEAALAGSIYDQAALALVTSADVGTTYANVLALKSRLTVAQDNRKLLARTLDLLETRHQEGATSALEVEQQKTALSNADAGVAGLQNSLAAEMNALSLLLGQPPGGVKTQALSLDTLKVPDVAPGQPSSLLQRRPDIRSAEAALIAANADIGVARAAFFPSVNIGLAPSIGVSPLTNPAVAALDIAASLSAPLFRPSLSADLARVKARQQELAETYRKTVLTAFREVEDALTAVESAGVREKAYAAATQSAEKAYSIADARYRAGATDYLTLLDAERSLLSARDALVTARLDRMTAAISLYKAVGGGWQSGV